MSREDDGLEQALEALANGTEVVERLRNDTEIFMVLKSFRKRPIFKVDEEALAAEIAILDDKTNFGAFILGSPSGLKEAGEMRAEVRASRSRLVAISRALRDVHFKASRVYKFCASALRQKDGVSSLTAKNSEEVIGIILREITGTLDTVKRLSEDIKEALTNLDEKSKGIDAWLHLHKEYVFLTLNQGPHGVEDEENTVPPRKLGSRSRR
jgi:hypothetical protein